MNKLMVFSNEEFGEVRTINIDGEIWFVGKDVCNALSYGNHRQALKTNVDADDKVVHSMDTLGGTQPTTTINESGLYSLIMGSKLPTAKKFKRWVTSEVLPSIRKTGSYEHIPSGEIVVGGEEWLTPIQVSFSPSEVLKAMDIIANCDNDRVGYVVAFAEKMIGGNVLGQNRLEIPYVAEPSEKIARLMNYFNESQNKLSKRLGTSSSTLSRYINGELDLSNIKKIEWANNINVMEDYFF